jgi:hypothetical protein
MTRTILARLASPNLRDRFTAREDRVYLRLSDFRGHDIGITVYGTSPEQLLPFLVQSLKTAGYQGSWRVEDPPLTTQLVALVKSLDPVPKPCCVRCGKNLLIGQKIISVKGGLSRRKIYHESCYLSTLH